MRDAVSGRPALLPGRPLLEKWNEQKKTCFKWYPLILTYKRSHHDFERSLDMGFQLVFYVEISAAVVDQVPRQKQPSFSWVVGSSTSR